MMKNIEFQNVLEPFYFRLSYYLCAKNDIIKLIMIQLRTKVSTDFQLTFQITNKNHTTFISLIYFLTSSVNTNTCIHVYDVINGGHFKLFIYNKIYPIDEMILFIKLKIYYEKC